MEELLFSNLIFNFRSVNLFWEQLTNSQSQEVFIWLLQSPPLQLPAWAAVGDHLKPSGPPPLSVRHRRTVCAWQRKAYQAVRCISNMDRWKVLFWISQGNTWVTYINVNFAILFQFISNYSWTRNCISSIVHLTCPGLWPLGIMVFFAQYTYSHSLQTRHFHPSAVRGCCTIFSQE